jgi:hypothetical protein
MNKPVELTEEEAKEVAGGTGPAQTTSGFGTSPALRLPPTVPSKPPALGNIPTQLER